MPIVSAFRTILRVVGAALIVMLSPALRAQESSAAADGFDPNVDGNIYALAVQPDGKILIAGSFANIRANGATTSTGRSNLTRLNSDGTLDTTFIPDINGQVNAVILQSDGQILIGGKFTSIDGTTRNHVARLEADGTLDPSFDPNIEKWTTTLGDLTPTVYELAVDQNGRVLVGGDFSTVKPNGGAEVSRSHVARFNSDGSIDPTFSADTNSSVLAFAVQADGSVLIGGSFTTIGGQPIERLARFDPTIGATGAIDPNYHPTPNAAVDAIALLPDGLAVVGGSFTTFQPGDSTTLVTRNYITALNSDGTVGTYGAITDGPVSTLLPMPDGTMMVGGTFGNVGNALHAFVARLLANGYIDPTFFVSANAAVYAIGAQTDGSIILAGAFTTIQGDGVDATVRNHIARVSTLSNLDADFHPDVNGRMQTSALQTDGKLLVGGTFTSVAGVTHNGIVRLGSNGAVDSSFNANIPGTVSVIVQQSDGKILVGGSFSRVNGVSQQNIARLNSDGSLDTAFDVVINAQVSAIVLQSDGKILVGGSFSAIQPHGTTDSTVRNGIARLNTDGTLDTAFDPNAAGSVSAILVQSDGKIVFGGSFSTLLPNGSTTYINRLSLARVNADGTVDTTFNASVNGAVLTMALQGDGQIVVGGSFQQVVGTGATTIDTRGNIARLTTTGTLDASFDPHANGVIREVAIQPDGKILIGGYFTTLQPNGGAVVSQYDLARFNTDGTIDGGFDFGIDVLPGNDVLSFLFPDSSHIIVGGSFTAVHHGSDYETLSRFVRVALDGTIDTSFDASASTAGGLPIEALTVESNGNILVGGTFAQVGGTISKNLAEFYPDGFANPTFAPSADGPVHAIAQLPNQGAAITTQATGFAWFDSSGGLKAGFAFPSNVTFTAVNKVVVQSDGKILIAGNMTIDQTPTDTSDTPTSVALARFNPDGSLDTGFTFVDYDQTLYTVSIYAISVQSNGQILIGGDFNAPIHGTTLRYLSRLNADGSIDTSFAPTPDAVVYAIATQSDGKIVIGGGFQNLQPSANLTSIARNRIARLNSDGTVDGNFNPDANSTVYALLIKPGGNILAGGIFTTFQPNGTSTITTRSYLAELTTNGTLTATDFGVNSTVTILTPQADNSILVGGFFSTIGGQNRNNIARLNTDDTVDTTFDPNPNGGVAAIAVLPDNTIVIGGGFTALQPNQTTVYDPSIATPRNHIARLNPDGTIYAAFNPNLDQAVTGLTALPDGTIIAAGVFTTIQPTGAVLIGGSFGQISGVSVNNLALFSSDGSVSSAFQPNPDGGVYCLLPLTDSRILVAGAFTTLSGATRHGLARFDADQTLDPTFDPNANGTVYTVALQPDGRLVVGGSFTSIGGGARNYLARLNTDGTLDSSFSATITGTVHAVALQGDGKILVLADGGAGGSVLSRVDTSGNPDATFTAVASGSATISTFALQDDGKIVVGGNFTTIAGAGQAYLARLNANGTVDTAFNVNPNGAVTALALQNDGKLLLAGSFSAIGSLPRYGIARITPVTPPSESFVLSADRTSATWVRSGGGPEIYSAIVETSSDQTTWTTLGDATRIPGTANWRISGLNPSLSGGFFLRVRGLTSSLPNASTGIFETFGAFYLIPVPVITSATAVGGTTGSNFVYAIGASAEPTSFSATGLPAGLNFDPSTGIISGQPTQTGTFQVNIGATNSYGTGSTTVTIIVSSSPTGTVTGHLLDLSCLATVTNSQPLILGFAISGTSPKSVILRADGPALAAENVPNPLAQPELVLHDQLANRILLNAEAWGGSQTLQNLFEAVGLTPLDPNSADAAAAVTLNPGVYTAVVLDAGNTTDGGSVLAQLYDAGDGSQQFAAMSARGYVDASSLLIGGFVITGSAPRQILIRGVGPSLGLADSLADPAIAVYNQSGQQIALNDNWQTPVSGGASGADLAAAATTVGDTPLDDGSKDAAVLVTLAPGIYTAHVTNSNVSTGGTALIEIYEVP